MAANWAPYVQAAQAIGFTYVDRISWLIMHLLMFRKVCIIHRASYQTLASSSPSHIATAWKDKTMNDKMEELVVDVNENQELLNDWKDEKNRTFAFFGQKFNIILRDTEEGSFVVCSKKKDVCIARQFNTIWFVAFGATQKATKDNKGKSFSEARAAFPLICKAIFDSLEENGI